MAVSSETGLGMAYRLNTSQKRSIAFWHLSVARLLSRLNSSEPHTPTIEVRNAVLMPRIN